MKDFKLISMVDFVNREERVNEQTDIEGKIKHICDFTEKVINYANFLKQPLTLGMFVPCVDSVPIEEPSGIHCTSLDGTIEANRLLEQYQQAKERVLFIIPDLETDIEELKKLITGSCIELIADGEGVTLTPSALKQIGLTL